MIASLFAAYALVITGLYTGSLAPGATWTVRFETRTDTAAVCTELERSIKTNLSRLGATMIRGKCRKR